MPRLGTICPATTLLRLGRGCRPSVAPCRTVPRHHRPNLPCSIAYNHKRRHRRLTPYGMALGQMSQGAPQPQRPGAGHAVADAAPSPVKPVSFSVSKDSPQHDRKNITAMALRTKDLTINTGSELGCQIWARLAQI
jgi:hypothetical protein